MDRWQALYNFWSRFGLNAYEENSVPEDAGFPRLTYQASVSTFNEPVPLSASIWYRDDNEHDKNWRPVDQKADEVSAFIGMGGIMEIYDGGALWVRRGSPFAQRMSDPDTSVRRVVLQIEVEFLSAN